MDIIFEGEVIETIYEAIGLGKLYTKAKNHLINRKIKIEDYLYVIGTNKIEIISKSTFENEYEL